MASQNPYDPPQSKVSREVPANPKFVKELLSAWPDDTRMLRKLRWQRFICYLTLITTIGYLTLVLLGSLSLTKLTLVVAVIAGCAFGLGVFFAAALDQWPTFKKYLDWERMQNDYDGGDDT